MKVFETPLYTFELTDNQKVLKFIWTDATKDMNFGHFQEACMVYAGLAIEYGVQLLLINTLAFQYTLPDDYMDWKNAVLNPRYAKIPVAKHAYVLPPAGYDANKEVQYQESTYENRFFATEADALHWLLNS